MSPRGASPTKVGYSVEQRVTNLPFFTFTERSRALDQKSGKCEVHNSGVLTCWPMIPCHSLKVKAMKRNNNTETHKDKTIIRSDCRKGDKFSLTAVNYTHCSVGAIHFILVLTIQSQQCAHPYLEVLGQWGRLPAARPRPPVRPLLATCWSPPLSPLDYPLHLPDSSASTLESIALL